MNAMTRSLNWDTDGADWPHRGASRHVRAAGIAWQVQQMGAGPDIVLLHGTGSSTHSWRDLAPALARDFRVTALDLPGHGFTQGAPRELQSLFGMAVGVGALLRELDVRPAIVAGHSAGAAIAVQMAIDGRAAPQLLVGINAALLALRGLAGHVFSPLAKVLNRLPFVPQVLARRSFDRAAVESMIVDTGSRIDPAGLDLYLRLAQSPGHVAAAFGMMAEWDLPRLERSLGKLRTPLVLIVGGGDRTISPRDADRVRKLLPRTQIVELPGLGHLAHEERPGLVRDAIVGAARRAGVLAGEG